MSLESERWKALLEPEGLCPEAGEIYMLVHGEVSAASREKLESHLRNCARCATELALYRDNFERISVARGEEADVQWITAQLRRRTSEITGETGLAESAASRQIVKRFYLKRFFALPGTPAMAVAAAVLLLTVGIYFMTKTAPEIRVPSVNDTSMELRSAQIEIIAPSGDVDTVPTELRWKPRDSAARYEVRLLEVDHVELWKSEAAGTGIVLPGDISARIVPAKKLLWDVTAFDASGRRLASSGEISFRLVMAPRPAVQK